MTRSRSHRLVISALFAAAGLILPYFTSHAFAIPGTVLLPMHIPVLLCGLICGARYGALCGVVVPVISCILTGMPAAYPMLLIMAPQLFTMGLISGALHNRLKLHVLPSLLISMLSGWAVYGLAYAALFFAGSGELRALSVTAAIVQGLPGIFIQLLLIPAVAAVIKRRNIAKAPANTYEGHDIMLTKALDLLETGKATCIIIKDNEIAHTASGRGVSPLLKLYENNPGLLGNSFVADKIIGKAAAMLLVLGGAQQVYGGVMSTAANEYLTQRGVIARYGLCVDVISNRDKTGICPIERSVLDIDDPHEGLERIKSAINELMKPAI